MGPGGQPNCVINTIIKHPAPGPGHGLSAPAACTITAANAAISHLAARLNTRYGGALPQSAMNVTPTEARGFLARRIRLSLRRARPAYLGGRWAPLPSPPDSAAAAAECGIPGAVSGGRGWPFLPRLSSCKSYGSRCSAVTSSAWVRYWQFITESGDFITVSRAIGPLNSCSKRPAPGCFCSGLQMTVISSFRSLVY